MKFTLAATALLVTIFAQGQAAKPNLDDLYITSPLSISSLIISSGWDKGPKVVLPTTGDIMLQGYDDKGNINLTVYRTGRVEAKDAEAIDKDSALFWMEFTKYYRDATGQCFGSTAK